MLNTPIDSFVYKDGKVCGVKFNNDIVTKCKMVVCDPSYVPRETVDIVNKIIRTICIINHPINQTDCSSSCQIVISQKQFKRHNDIYISLLSSCHGVVVPGKYLAMISTIVETDTPEKEIEPALDLLKPIEMQFTKIYEQLKPKDPNFTNNVFIPSSFDATSHFEHDTQDILQM